MAFVLHAERDAAGSIFYLPARFDGYLENIYTTSNVPDLFAEDYFKDLPVRVHVPNQPPPAVPHVAPGTPPQAPPPANNMGTTSSNDDDDDDQSFSGDDDASCGDDGGYVKGDGHTITNIVTAGSNVQTAQVALPRVHGTQTILNNVLTTQTTAFNVQNTQAAADNFQALLNIQAASQANRANHVNATRFPSAFAEYDSDVDDFDLLSVLSDDSDESEARFPQRHSNQEIVPQENSSHSGGGEEPNPSAKDTVTLRVNNDRPNFSFHQLRDSPIASLLPDFLARLESANQELEAERVAGTLATRRIEIDENQNIAENGQYIEMNLGLGVLEERNGDTSTSSDSEGSSSSTGEGVMERLLGGKRKRDTEDEETSEVKKPKIEEL